MSKLFSFNNHLLGTVCGALGVNYPIISYRKTYSGEANSTIGSALNSGHYIELERDTFHIDFEGTFRLFQADKYSGCKVVITDENGSVASEIEPSVNFVYISEDTKTVTINGYVDIDLNQYPDEKYFIFLRDSANVGGEVEGTIYGTRYGDLI